MIIKKFKSGKIKLQVIKSDFDDGELSENIYHDDLFFKDVSIDFIDGDVYIIDSNKKLVYNYFNSYSIQNPLKSLLDDLEEKKVIYLYPLTKKESKELFESLYSDEMED